MIPILIVVGVVVVLVLFVISLYNRFVQLRNRIDNAWAQVDVQLQAPVRPDPEPRRDGEGLRVARARDVRARDRRRATRCRSARTVEEQGQAENMLTGALRQLFAVAEAYPGAARERELPAAAERADADGGPDRDGAADLQRHRPDLQQRDPDVPGRARSPARSASRRGRSSRSKRRSRRRREVDFRDMPGRDPGQAPPAPPPS